MQRRQKAGPCHPTFPSWPLRTSSGSRDCVHFVLVLIWTTGISLSASTMPALEVSSVSLERHGSVRSALCASLATLRGVENICILLRMWVCWEQNRAYKCFINSQFPSGMSRWNCYFKNIISKTELQNNFIMRDVARNACFWWLCDEEYILHLYL